jgi:hypothetical protein
MHRKVWLAWGRWWAVQVVFPVPELALGIHIEPRRPLLDVYLPWLTLAIGKHPLLTDPRTKHRHSCRGFVMAEVPL